jgi:hypothetical protein
MLAQDSQRRSRPTAVLIISIALGAMAAIQIAAFTMLLFFGQDLPQFQRVLFQLSALDWVAIYVLASVLAISMWNLLQLRKSAVSWLLTYVGLSSWVALFYSLSPRNGPHFDEGISLAGLLVAMLVLAYIFKLKQEEILK